MGSIPSQLEKWEAWIDADTVCAFAALPGEPDPLTPWPEGKSIALPRVDGEILVPHVVESPADLRPGCFGILEPSVDAPVAGNAFDVILVPGLAFDQSGRRLGRGRGYYDRFLAGTSGLRVAVCFDWQLVDTIPVEPHDLAMDAILTPSKIIICSREGD